MPIAPPRAAGAPDPDVPVRGDGSLTLVLSDRPGVLVERLAEDLRREPTLGPFDVESILIQSQGMARWIRHELARRHGCAAGLELPFPAAFAQALGESLGVASVDPRFTRDAMAWRILELLEDGLAEEGEFVALKRFAAGAETRTRLGLSRRLAATFDDYLLYRPDVLLAWEEGTDAGLDAAEAQWQRALWLRLCDVERPHHQARWHRGLLAALADPAVASRLPRRLSVFGIAALPTAHVELVRAIARHVDVRAYLQVPPPESWNDREMPRNPLFAAFGGTSRELVAMLGERAMIELYFPSDEGTGFLATLRKDVRAGLSRGRSAGQLAPVAVEATDRSLSIHCCHSPLREVEVLRDQLLDAFAADPTLRPHDVLVMVPDVALYAPFVDAVFGSAEEGVPRLPYRIAGRPVAEDSAIADAALRVLRLHGARWTAPEVLGLLDLAPIRRAAGLTPQGAQRAVRWVQDTAIRWGRDGAMREQRFGVPAFDGNSWRAGMDRLLMGYATGRVDALADGVAPAAGELIGDASALGCFAAWIERLFDALDSLDAPQTLGGWAAALGEVIDALVAAEDEDDEREIAELLAVLDGFATLERDTGIAREVELSVVRDWLERELGGESLAGGFLTGGMTVCALKPMRAIPFRVIAMVGMDDASFPRRNRRAAYDLLALEPRVGDPDSRADDRQLFLDTILSASDRLILSYVGRSATDNSERAVSVVAAELLDIVDQSFEAPPVEGKAPPPRSLVTVEHRLQPFSAEYFTGDGAGKLFSFSTVHRRGAAAAGAPADEARFIDDRLPALPPVGVISLRDLVRCWQNPARYFCERVLGMLVSDDETPLEECEPLTVGRLGRYKVRQRALEAHLAGARDAGTERALAAAIGELPPGALCDEWMDAMQEGAEELIGRVGTPTFLPTLPVDVRGPDWRICGRVTHPTDAGRLVALPGRLKNRQIVDAWIHHLALCAERGPQPVTRVVAGDTMLELAPVEDALELLDQLVRGFRESLSAPIPVFERASRAYVEPTRGKLPIVAARECYDPKRFEKSPSGDSEDESVALCWRGRDPLEDEESFARWSHVLWTPIGAHRREVGA